ncbi:MAG: 30S ribosome-binding factor RbfA [Phycisphaerales bacterium]|jgi:ribosome-binding factor A|nr:30S ribosome-binding factor RbfA [Phycisphaeraceae bacterium]
MTSHRTNKVASVLREAIQSILSKGLADPRLDGCMVTVTEVSVSPDLRNATVHISILPDNRQVRAIAAIKHAAAHLRRKVSDHTGFNTTPQLSFVLDDRAKRQAAVMRTMVEHRDEHTEADATSDQTGDAGAADRDECIKGDSSDQSSGSKPGTWPARTPMVDRPDTGVEG